MPLLAAAACPFSSIAPVSLGCVSRNSGRIVGVSVLVLLLFVTAALLSSIIQFCLNLLSVKCFHLLS